MEWNVQEMGGRSDPVVEVQLQLSIVTGSKLLTFWCTREFESRAEPSTLILPRRLLAFSVTRVGFNDGQLPKVFV